MAVREEVHEVLAGTVQPGSRPAAHGQLLTVEQLAAMDKASGGAAAGRGGAKPSKSKVGAHSVRLRRCWLLLASAPAGDSLYAAACICVLAGSAPAAARLAKLAVVVGCACTRTGRQQLVLYAGALAVGRCRCSCRRLHMSSTGPLQAVSALTHQCASCAA